MIRGICIGTENACHHHEREKYDRANDNANHGDRRTSTGDETQTAADGKRDRKSNCAKYKTDQPGNEAYTNRADTDQQKILLCNIPDTL